MTTEEARVFHFAILLADRTTWTSRDTWPHAPVLVPSNLAILLPLKRAVEDWRASVFVGGDRHATA